MKHFFSLRFYALVTLVIVRSFIFIAGGEPPTKTVIKSDHRAILVATKEIFKEVSQLRQLSIKHNVKSGFRTEAELKKEVIDNFNEAASLKEFNTQTKLLVKLGLIPLNYNLRSEMIKILVEQIGGFYKPRTGEFFLTDRTGLDEQKTVIAHELTHALQDQHFNLRRFEKFQKNSGDKKMAIQSLIEGDATVVMFDYWLKPYGKDTSQLPISITSAMSMLSNSNVGLEKSPTLAAAPNVIKQSLIFPYFAGAGFVQFLVQKKGWTGVSNTFTKLPESTEQIIHPEKYLSQEAPILITLPSAEKILGNNWNSISRDNNGEFGYRLILGGYLDEENANRGAAGWNGDAYELYEDKTSKKLLLIQYTTWDTEVEAKEFYDLYLKRIQKRYPDSKIDLETEKIFQVTTNEDKVFIEKRGSDILILEGVPDGKNIDKDLSSLFWQGTQKK